MALLRNLALSPPLLRQSLFSDEGMLGAAEGRVSSLPVRVGQILLIVAAATLVLNSALAPIIWLVCVYAAMAVDYWAARAYLHAPRKHRRMAKLRFILSVSVTVSIFAQLALIVALSGGAPGRTIAMTMAAGSLISVMTYMHRAQAFVMLTALPCTLVLLALPFLPMGLPAAAPWQATIAVLMATGAFLVYLARSSMGNAKLIEQLLDARHIAERERAKADARRQEAEEAHRVKARFVDTMSHELRTPLNAVIGYAEILQEDLEHEDRHQSARDALKIQTAARSLLGLVDQVLNLSKLESGRMALDIGEIHIAALINEAIDTVTPEAEAGGNRIGMTVAPDLDVVRTDIGKLRQCVLNLLENACKFTKNGVIVVKAERDGAYLILSVSDTGIGMNPTAAARLFTPFMQGDASQTRQHGGAGLGLAVTRKFVEVLDGDIRVVSELGKGSTFTLRLPLQYGLRATGIDDGAVDVLIIDDDPAACDLVSRAAERVGLSARAVGTAADGWSAAQAAPGMIVLDIGLPDGDGWDLLERLRATSDLMHTPVIVMTISEDRARAARLGASFFLRKPADRDELCATLARFARPKVEPASAPPQSSSSEAAA